MWKRAVFSTVCGLALAQAGFGDEIKPKSWRDMPEVSIVSMTGNTRSTTISLRNLLVWEKNPWKMGVAFGGLGAYSNREVTAERYYADEKVDWAWTPRTYLFEKIGWSKDRFAGIRGREEAFAGPGHHFLASATNKWFGELGAGYIFEDRLEADSDNFPAVRGFTKYLHQFSNQNAFTQDAEWFINLKGIHDYRVRTETAIVSKLTDKVSIKTSFSWNHVNEPPPGRLADDTTTSAALVGTF